MTHAVYPQIDDAFGHWLAGFIDGEGCFMIQRQQGRSLYYTCRMTLVLRADDAAILREIHEKTMVGRIHRHQATGRRVDGRTHHPGCAWAVQDKAGCLKLVELLDRYPLRAKKSGDYAIWREAVQLWACVRWPGRSKGFDWARFAELANELRMRRGFDLVEPAVEPPSPQLKLAA